jgi:hypothetical protein
VAEFEPDRLTAEHSPSSALSSHLQLDSHLRGLLAVPVPLSVGSAVVSGIVVLDRALYEGEHHAEYGDSGKSKFHFEKSWVRRVAFQDQPFLVLAKVSAEPDAKFSTTIPDVQLSHIGTSFSGLSDSKKSIF